MSIYVTTDRITVVLIGAIGIYTKPVDDIRKDTYKERYYVLISDTKFIDDDFEVHEEFYNDGKGSGSKE